MKNVVLFDQFGAGTIYSGPGNYFVNLYSANNISDYRISLVHGCDRQGIIDVFYKQYKPFSSGGLFNNWMFSVKSCQLVKSLNFDIFQATHCYMTSINAARISIRKGVPTFLRVAKSKSELTNRNFIAQTFDFSRTKINVIKNCSGVVAISDEIKCELLELGIPEEKIYRINNGVDVNRFSKAKDFIRHPFFDGSPIIAFCGAIISRKKPHLILEILRKLPKRYKACFIGPYDSNVKYVGDFLDYICKHQLNDRVLLTGYINNPEQYLKLCNYFCLFSENEGMPNALLEAMACGLIPFATPISGITDIISSDSLGYLVDRPDADIISSLIMNIDDVENNKCSDLIVKHISNNFSAQAAFYKYDKMYEEHL